jgi:hypothetical protein
MMNEIPKNISELIETTLDSFIIYKGDFSKNHSTYPYSTKSTIVVGYAFVSVKKNSKEVRMLPILPIIKHNYRKPHKFTYKYSYEGVMAQLPIGTLYIAFHHKGIVKTSDNFSSAHYNHVKVYSIK